MQPTIESTLPEKMPLCGSIATIGNVEMACENEAGHPGPCWHNVRVASTAGASQERESVEEPSEFERELKAFVVKHGHELQDFIYRHGYIATRWWAPTERLRDEGGE